MRQAFPDISQADLDGYFLRKGKLRNRFKAPALYRDSFDFFLSMFWYHQLDSLLDVKAYDEAEIDGLVEKIKDRVDEFRERYGLAERKLFGRAYGAKPDSFWNATASGIGHRVLFRRVETPRGLKAAS